MKPREDLQMSLELNFNLLEGGNLLRCNRSIKVSNVQLTLRKQRKKQKIVTENTFNEKVRFLESNIEDYENMQNYE